MRSLTQFDYMLDSYDSQDQILEDLRSNFINTFPVDYIRNKMTVAEYIEGKGNKDSFCNRLERELSGLGSIKGATASKFGIYYSQKYQKYLINKVWQTPKDNPNLKLSFKKLRESIADLIEAGNSNDQKVIETHPLAPMVKMKILSIYYPEKYLNIFSKRMLDYFVFQFYGNSVSRNISLFEKQRLLLKLKYEDNATKNWNNIKFGNYFYHLFPAAYKLGEENQFNGSKNNKAVKLEQIVPLPPREDSPEFPVAFNKTAVKYKAKNPQSQKRFISKVDYVTKQKANLDVGELGEREVFEYEKKRLAEFGNLQRQIQWQSKKSDAIGYDILSFEKDGTPRQIEVKSTTDKVSNKFSFIMTENERQHALSLSNYWIYRVFDVKKQPIIYKIKNPLKDNLAEIIPVKYQVNVKIKK